MIPHTYLLLHHHHPLPNYTQTRPNKIFKTNSLPAVSHLKKNKLQGLGQQTDSLGGIPLFHLPAHVRIHICALLAHRYTRIRPLRSYRHQLVRILRCSIVVTVAVATPGMGLAFCSGGTITGPTSSFLPQMQKFLPLSNSIARS